MKWPRITKKLGQYYCSSPGHVGVGPSQKEAYDNWEKSLLTRIKKMNAEAANRFQQDHLHELLRQLGRPIR